MAPLGCALVRICRNGKGKNAFLSSFFPVPVFSRSFPRTSLVGTLQLPTSGAHIFLTTPPFSTLFGAADVSWEGASNESLIVQFELL